LFVGRRVVRLLREHGLTDVQANVITHVWPVGHPGRMLAFDFVENLSGRFIDDGLVEADELTALKAELRSHLEDPNTFVIDNLFIQAWGHKPR
jgi:hypothetical protein